MSKASEDFPLPLTPATTTSWLRGMLTNKFSGIHTLNFQTTKIRLFWQHKKESWLFNMIKAKNTQNKYNQHYDK